MHLTPATGGGGSQVRLFKAGAPLFLLSFMIILDYQDDLDKFCAPVKCVQWKSSGGHYEAGAPHQLDCPSTRF